MQQVRTISPGFSTADAEQPALSLNNQTLVVEFVDWKEEKVRVVFSDVYGLKWQSIEELLGAEPYDGSCEILNSEWLAEHVRQSCIDNHGGNHHHYRLNFNALGSLDVICRTFDVESAESV